MKFRFLAPAVLAVAACGETGTATIGPRSFDRPVDVAFGCYGRLKLTATGEETVAPQPLRSCAVRALGNGDPTDRAPVLRRLSDLLDGSRQGRALRDDLRTGITTLPAWMQEVVRELLADGRRATVPDEGATMRRPRRAARRDAAGARP